MQENINYSPQQVFGEHTIKKWKEEGHWPPPKGVQVLPESRVNDEEVIKLLNNLMKVSTPKQKKIVEEILRENYDVPCAEK